MSYRTTARKIEGGHKLGARDRREHRADAKDESRHARRCIDRKINENWRDTEIYGDEDGDEKWSMRDESSIRKQNKGE